jgi:hypothetical protein
MLCVRIKQDRNAIELIYMRVLKEGRSRIYMPIPIIKTKCEKFEGTGGRGLYACHDRCCKTLESVHICHTTQRFSSLEDSHGTLVEHREF